MNFKIEWDIRAYKELKSIENKKALEILNSVGKLTHNPEKSGKSLKGKFKGKYRMRVGDYRIIYWVKDNESTVYVISVGHRKDIYD